MAEEKKLDTKEEQKDLIPDSLPKVLVDLYNHKCAHEINKKDGSITFYPTPDCQPSTKALDSVQFTDSHIFSEILKAAECTKLEGINKEKHKTTVINTRDSICSFITAAWIAWKDHYPFRFKPDHIWLLILQSVAKHVEQNAEKLRNKYVTFEGKKELIVYRDWVKGDMNNDWADIISEFAEQIDKNTVDDTVSLLENNFSSSSMTDKIAVKVTVMDVCKSFFKYKCVFGCGFPKITLDGNKSDWVLLKQKCETLLATKVEKRFGEKWGKALLPLLDKFIDTFNGKIDGLFWNSMIKRGAKPVGSGGQTSKWFTGWINILFPFINGRENVFCEPYKMDLGYVKQGLSVNTLSRMGYGNYSQNEFGEGIDVDSYPIGIASAPVKLDANGKEYDLKFVSGFMGFQQDQKTLEITPNVSWFIGEQ